jgi:hypothetical protein
MMKEKEEEDEKKRFHRASVCVRMHPKQIVKKASLFLILSGRLLLFCFQNERTFVQSIH